MAAGLGIDVVDVGAHGTGGNAQLLGDVTLRVALGEEGQDLRLARRETEIFSNPAIHVGQGLLRLGDDLLDESLVVSHGCEARERDGRVETEQQNTGDQRRNGGDQSRLGLVKSPEQPGSTDLPDQYRRQDEHLLAKGKAERSLAKEILELGELHRRQAYPREP